MKAGYEPQPLGSRASVIAGQSPEGKYYNNVGRGLPFYQGKKDFGKRVLQPPTVWTSQTTKEAQAGDILMSVRAPVGPINFASEAVCIGRGLAAIRCRDGLDRDFLFYQLLGMQADIAGKEGAVFASINKAEIEALSIVLPPLTEQRRIVAILDEAFEGIATAKANAEKNLRNARELIGTGYRSIVESFDQSEWGKEPVAELAAASKGSMRTGPFGSQLLHSEFVDEGIAVLGIDNAVANEFRWDKRRYISEAKYRDLARYRVHPGDVLITIMGTCGRCAVVPDDIPLAINTKHLCCITLDRQKCLPEYLHLYFLRDPLARAYLTAQAKGSIMAGLNMGIISALPVRLPSLDQQASIAERFDSLQTECDRQADIQVRKLAALDELKQSLLDRAFTGALTEKSPDEQVAEFA